MATELSRASKVLSRAALAIGLFIVAQGMLGMFRPEVFLGLVREFQYPPVLYVAAIMRVVFGLVLFLAAPASRATMLLQVLGVFIVAGGLVTPYFGIYFAHLILGWWSDGGGVMVRGWAAFALVLGGFIMYATWPERSRT